MDTDAQSSGQPQRAPERRNSPKHSRLRAWLRRTCVACFWLVMLLVLALVSLRVCTGCQLRRALTSLRASGLPCSVQGYCAILPSLPEGQNGARYFEAGLRLGMDPTCEPSKDLILQGGGAVPPLGQPVPENLRPPARQYVAANAECVALCKKGAAFDEARRSCSDYDMLRHDAISFHLRQIERYGGVRRTARLLAIDAHVHYWDGHVDEAFRSCDTILRLAPYMKDEPEMTALMVRSAVDGMAVGAYERLLGLGEAPVSALARAETELAKTEGTYDLAKALAGEMAHNLDFLQTFLQKVWLHRWVPVCRWDLASYVSDVQALVEDSKRPLPDIVTKYEAVWVGLKSRQSAPTCASGKCGSSASKTAYHEILRPVLGSTTVLRAMPGPFAASVARLRGGARSALHGNLPSEKGHVAQVARRPCAGVHAPSPPGPLHRSTASAATHGHRDGCVQRRPKPA